MKDKFWEYKRLEELTVQEWESLCDGCGKCCLEKLEYEDTKEILYTNVACRLLDLDTGCCSNYRMRQSYVGSCIKLTPSKISEISWIPKTCAYRLIANGKPLPEYHHLICGDRKEIHRIGQSVAGRVVSERVVERLEDHIVDWAD